jgi:predicted DsbA family dithiol-disulfide isomerase
MVLLKAKHEQGRDIADFDTLIELARDIGLKMAQFQKDLYDNSLISRLARDHTFAVENLGIFGTPTLVFPRGKPVFLKLASPPPPSEGLAVFDEIRRISEQR